jgi:hypothetical protein
MGPLYDSSDRLSTVTRWFLVAALPSQPTPAPEEISEE